MSKRTFERDGFVITVRREEDMDADLSYLERDYAEESPEDRETYLTQDAERMRDYRRGHWYMMEISVDVAIKTATNWALLTKVGRAALGGIESDSGEDYLTSTEEDLISGALADARLTYEALAVRFQSKEVTNA